MRKMSKLTWVHFYSDQTDIVRITGVREIFWKCVTRWNLLPGHSFGEKNKLYISGEWIFIINFFQWYSLHNNKLKIMRASSYS